MVNNPRRFYLLKAQAAGDELSDLESLWWAKQEAQPGTLLSGTFPAYDALYAAHYRAVEDLTGATADELIRRVGLTASQADAAIAAIG